jgi:hypothetical protein
MIPVRVTLDDTRALRRIDALLQRAVNFRSLMEGPVRQLVRRLIVDQFRTRGGISGRPWKALALSTIRKKQRAGVVGRGPLKFTTEMYQSFVNLNHPDRRETITARGYSLRSVRKNTRGQHYSAVHQRGGGRVPMRQIVPDPAPQGFLRELKRLVKGYLIEVQFGSGRSRVR